MFFIEKVKMQKRMTELENNYFVTPNEIMVGQKSPVILLKLLRERLIHLHIRKMSPEPSYQFYHELRQLDIILMQEEAQSTTYEVFLPQKKNMNLMKPLDLPTSL